MSSTPALRHLTAEECKEILSAHVYGRLAFTFHDRVDIEPIHYVFEDPWIVARTGEGAKLRTLSHHPWVAFEVDEVDAMFSWRSVVVKGTCYMLDDDSSDLETRAQAIALYQRLLPEAFTDGDPLPDRRVLVRIHVDELHGRSCSSTGA